MAEKESKRHRTEGSRDKPTTSADAAAGRSVRAAIVKDLREWDTVAMFHAPVTDDVVPGYSTVIKRPMDLSTIQKRNDKGAYDKDPTNFVDDLHLMISNALLFNEHASVWYKHAKSLKKHLRKTLAKHGIEHNDDEVFLPSMAAVDSEATLAKEEQRGVENLNETLDGMKADLELSIDELRAKYARKAPESRASSSSHNAASVSSADEEGDDDEEEEEEDDESDDGSSEESESDSDVS